MDGRIIAVLAATTSTFDRYLHIAVGEMVQSTERILKMHCHIGVSRIREHLGECHEAYRGAMSALGYCTPGRAASIILPMKSGITPWTWSWRRNVLLRWRI